MKTHTQLAKLLFATLLFSTLVLVFSNSFAINSLDDGFLAYGAGDYKKALEIFKPLAEQGDATAQLDLASMYWNGEGVPQDNEEGVKWVRKAAEQGHAAAQLKLGWMYKKGQGVKQDDKQAFYWFRKAAEQGHAAAQLKLGLMYEDGQGVEQSYLEVYKWYSLYSEQPGIGESVIDRIMEKFLKKVFAIVAGFQLDSAQKKEADEWVKNWKPKYGK